MISTLLDFWLEVFTRELMHDTNDELRMIIVKKAPLQEDPTRKAPYLIMHTDEEKGLEPVGPQEIGGPLRWKVHMKMRAAPKVATTVDRAYHLVDVLTSRICHLLRQETFAHPEGINGAMMDNWNWLIVDKVKPKVYGGEREWLSYVDIEFHCFMREPGPFPFGNSILPV
jgi:hypothetical protein